MGIFDTALAVALGMMMYNAIGAALVSAMALVMLIVSKFRDE